MTSNLVDLTAITTPYGLLDRETQEALEAHGGPYEMYTGDGWRQRNHPSWGETCTYRVKPAPPKPREWWITGIKLHETKADAQSWVRRWPSDGPIIHVREVLE